MEWEEGGGGGSREAVVVVGLLCGIQPMILCSQEVADLAFRGLHDGNCLFEPQSSEGIDRVFSASTKS
jgi:hypothetical protein